MPSKMCAWRCEQHARSARDVRTRLLGVTASSVAARSPRKRLTADAD